MLYYNLIVIFIHKTIHWTKCMMDIFTNMSQIQSQLHVLLDIWVFETGFGSKSKATVVGEVSWKEK